MTHLSYAAHDGPPETARVAARGLCVVVAHDPAAPCHIRDLSREEGRFDGEGIVFGAVGLDAVQIEAYAEGGLKRLLISPSARELESLLDLAHLEAIRDGFAVKTTAKTTAGLAKAIEAHVAGMP